ncbi:MAG: hemerythrin domain-containing protein [Aestuariivirga sp.]|nr:hemerythrin domain-containing protein [Aestuariivirga sp.]
MTIETKQANWVPQLAALNVAALIDHIVSHYHEIHRQELPDLLALARKVERVHHDVPEAPLGLAHVLERLSAELETHMQKEEFVLFPAMQQGVKEDIMQPITMLRHEHEDHAGAIRLLEELARGFAVPEGACGSWQRLYAGLKKLCEDISEHIRVENDVLFPRFELTTKSGCICAHG